MAYDYSNRTYNPESAHIPTVVPKYNTHPWVKMVFEEIERQGLQRKETCLKAGISQTTLRHWAQGRIPNINLLERVLLVLGIEIWPVRIEKRPAKWPRNRTANFDKDPVRDLQKLREAA